MRHAKPRRLSLGTVLGALALMVSLGGVAFATIPGSDGTIEGCYNPATAKPPYPLTVVDNPSDCASPSVLLPFNQTGPAGPVGPQGPTGSQGPAGSAPASGANIYHTTVTSTRNNFVDIKPGRVFDLTLQVPSGTYSIVADVNLRGFDDVANCTFSDRRDCFNEESVRCELVPGPNQNVIYVGAAAADEYTGYADLGFASGATWDTSIPATIVHTFAIPGWIHYSCLDYTPTFPGNIQGAFVLTDTIVATRVLGVPQTEREIVPRSNVVRTYPLSSHQISILRYPGTSHKPKSHR